jgi:2-phosphoglycerate kinase
LQFLHLVVHVADEQDHRARFLERGRGARERPGKRYLDNFAAIRAIQSYLVARAREENVPLVENRDFDAAIHAVLGHVLAGVEAPLSVDLLRP